MYARLTVVLLDGFQGHLCVFASEYVAGGTLRALLKEKVGNI